jgi:hypothetical protein
MASSGRAGLAALGLGLTLLIGACQAVATPAAGPTASPPAASPARPATAPPLAPPATPLAPRPGTPTLRPGPIFNPTPAPPAPDASAAVPPGQPFALKIGQAITLQVSGIPEDSRCPRSVTCVWAGRAVVTLAVTPAGQPAGAVTVATCCPAAESSRARYGGHEVQLLRVLPYPLRHDVAIRPEEYTVELRVTAASP